MPGAGGHDHDHDHGHGHSHQGNDCKDHDEEDQHHHERSSLLPSGRTSDLSITHLNEVPPPSHDHSHSHGHGHDHGHESSDDSKTAKRNVNLHAAYLHVIGDLIQSVAVLIAGLVIWAKPTWIIVDPVCTLGFCIIVFYSTLGVVRSSVAVLLEEVPPQISWESVYRDLSSIENVTQVHCLHIWCISDGIPCISLHAFVTNGMDCGEALEKINVVCRKYDIQHITAQVQPGRDGGDVCITCNELVASKHCY